MDNDEKTAFKRWLTLASVSELQTALIKFQALEVRLTEAPARSDARYLKRGILNEMDARKELAAALNHGK